MGRKATSHELIKECIFTALMDLMKKKRIRKDHHHGHCKTGRRLPHGILEADHRRRIFHLLFYNYQRKCPLIPKLPEGKCAGIFPWQDPESYQHSVL